MSLPIIYGDWTGLSYVVSTDDGDVITYLLGSITGDPKYGIKYTRSTLTWADNHAGDAPYFINSSNDFATASSSVYNPTKLFGFHSDGALRFELNNGFWEDPTPTGSEGNSASCELIYNAAQNVMHYFMNATEPSTDMISTRNLHYRVRNASINNVSTDVNFNHYSGTHTHGDFNPTFAGTYQLEKVLTNPLEVLICDSASVTQGNLDAFNVSNTPPNTPRSRRGNLNFW